MGILRNIIDPYFRFRTLVIALKRNDYQKLQMIADDLNDHSDGDYLFTPEIIASKVMITFIDEAYQDSTRRIVKTILPEAKSQSWINASLGRAAGFSLTYIEQPRLIRNTFSTD